MLGTPKALEGSLRAGQSAKANPAGGESGAGNGRGGKGKRNYARLARSNEHSPGVAISGRESGYALQVRGRAKDSGVQAGQSLALQEIAAGPVDGREVERDGTAGKTQTEGGDESCRVTVRNKAGRSPALRKT